MRVALEPRLKASARATKLNVYEIAKSSIATLGHGARGTEIRLTGNQKIEFFCDRRLIEFLLTSMLMYLSRALRQDRSRSGIGVVVEEKNGLVQIEMHFFLGDKWRHDSNDDELNWMVATTLVNNLEGSIEPTEFVKLSKRLTISLPNASCEETP